MKYRVKLEKTEEGYAIWCPGLPGCWSQGATEEEALENVKAADPEKIRNYVAATTFKQPPASLMPGNAIKFDATGWNIYSIHIMIEWKDGLPRTVWPAQVRAMKAFFD